MNNRKTRLPSYRLTSREHYDVVVEREKKNNKKSQGEKEKGSKEKKKEDRKRKRNTKTDVAEKRVRRSSKKKQDEQAASSSKAKSLNSSAQVDETPCLLCEIRYCDSSVIWVKCKQCKGWACGDCAHAGRKKKVYVCDNCK